MRVQALELAIGEISEKLGDIVDQARGRTVAIAADNPIVTQVSELADRVESIELASRAGNVEADTVHDVEADSTMDECLALSTTTVTARVAVEGTSLALTDTGHFKLDMADGLCKPLAIGTCVRLLFPQIEHSDGCIYMSAMTVDPYTMELSTGWMPLLDKQTNTQFLTDFAV